MPEVPEKVIVEEKEPTPVFKKPVVKKPEAPPVTGTAHN